MVMICVAKLILNDNIPILSILFLRQDVKFEASYLCFAFFQYKIDSNCLGQFG